MVSSCEPARENFINVPRPASPGATLTSPSVNVSVTESSLVEAVDGARDLVGDVAVAQVGEHELAGPFRGVAVSAPVGGVEPDDVALVHGERGDDGVAL